MRKEQMDELLPSDRENLELLLESFRSLASLEQIVSAYCQSGRNLYRAHEMLSSMQRSTPNFSSSTSRVGLNLANSSQGYQSYIPKDKVSSVPKTKEHPTSLGTVSSVIGRDYGRHLPSAPASWRPKPMKLNSADIPVSEWEDQKDYTNPESMHHEIEGFLFQMLGEGFNLEKSTIHDILGQCGYDLEQSMETLMNLPPPTMEKSENLIKSHPEEVLCGDSPSSLPTNKVKDSRAQKAKKKRELEQEILGALFAAPERPEPVKIRSGKDAGRIKPHGRTVVCPMKDITIDYQPIISRKYDIEKNDVDSMENDYDILRKIVAEYKTTMKVYYTAAAVAFVNQEPEKAQTLQEEGDFFMKKAKEADDKANKRLVESNDEDEVTFDLHEFEPDTALRQLKIHVANFAGLSSIKYLKVIVGSSDGNAKHHASRKRRILKFLEKEKKEWTEEDDGWRIVIQLN